MDLDGGKGPIRYPAASFMPFEYHFHCFIKHVTKRMQANQKARFRGL